MLNEQNYSVVGEAVDGAEALQKAAELLPDLIVLDIGLPELNGLEVARHVLQIVPEAKIVFLSDDSSEHILQATLKLGPVGFIHKLYIHQELTKAIESVLKGSHFVGKGTEQT